MPSEEYKKRKRDYIQRYNKSHYRSMTITFRADSEDEMRIYSFLQGRYSTVQYIKDLVKADMMVKENEGE